MSTFTAVQGHWIRRWIKAPGFEDHTTRVHWMQAGPDYADVRVPATRPDVSQVRALCDLPPEALLDLARAEGFAGHITVSGDQCTWHREINWHGTPDVPDVGAIRFDGDGNMIEAGVLVDYTELWEPGQSAGSVVRRFAGDGREGVLVACGDLAVLGIGAPDAPSTKPILQALEAGRVPDDAARLFDGFHAVGRFDGHSFVAELATHPFCEGQEALTMDGNAVLWHRLSFDGQSDTIGMQMHSASA